MKEVIEFIGFGSILQIIIFVISLVWYGSRYGFRIETLEKTAIKQEFQNSELIAEQKKHSEGMQKMREWQVARDAESNIGKLIVESNEKLVLAISK